MRVSIILSTYNSPLWLEKVLWGYTAQTHTDFEIIVADDGSTAETRDLLEIMKKNTGLDIVHVWQEDQGFRKCRILNKSILQATSPYLVFSDGDCIPRNDFLEVHVRKSRPKCYLSGSYQKLPMALSQLINQEDILSGRCFDYAWLRKNGMPWSRKNIKLAISERMAKYLNAITPTRCNLKGSNASAWKEDILRVRGFDERMGWGGEDRELGIRLRNAGVKAIHVRYDALVIHLDHSRGYRNPDVVKKNRELCNQNMRQGIVVTEHGITE